MNEDASQPQLVGQSTFRRAADPGRPPPESAQRKRLIHTAVLLTIGVSLAYLAWRAIWTVDLGVWWVALPLLAAETHNTFGLILYTFALWDIDVSPPWRPVDSTALRVAVLIPTYNEPEEVLIPTIAAALALRPAHETYVLDDGRRPDIERLARELGAGYIARPDNYHAKAGNLNHAMSVIRADLYAIFDADHVAMPNFLRHTLGYFEDPRVAVVQTPQDFYNTDSFEHLRRDELEAFHEETLFYRVIAPGKNRWHAAFWCGTCAVVRASAIEALGGVATETVTEDIHTTIRLNRGGWRAVYHNEVLARGLAPADAVQYMLQRNRWAVGAMQVLRLENPLFAGGLSLGQRLAYATTLLAWFDSWRTLTFIVLPAIVIFSGASPIDAPGYVYAPLFLAAFASQYFALSLMSRGYYAPIVSLVFEMLRLPAVLPATLALFTPRSPRQFNVTPKGASEERSEAPLPPLLTALAALCLASVVWFALSIAGLTFSSYHGSLPAVVGSVLFATLDFLLIVTAIRRIKAAEFRGNRRAGVRFDVFMRARLNGSTCIIRNVSLTGARLELSDPDLRQASIVTLQLNDIRIRAQIIRLQTDAALMQVAVRFLPGQTEAIGSLALALMDLAEPQAARPEPEAERAV